MDAPGPFFFLVRDGVVTREALAPLLARLPPESYVGTAVRDGEGYDSERWPVARDAALASSLARRFDDPEIGRALTELEHAAGDATRLRAQARRAGARYLAAAGGEPALLERLWPDATADDLAVFGEPAWAVDTAWVVMNLCSAHHAAADGLYAFHVHRRLPGPSAEAVVRLIRSALDSGRIDLAGLVEAALQLLPGPAPWFAVTPSSAARPMIEAIADACAEVRRISGATACAVMSETFVIPGPPGAVHFMILAGPRALVVLELAGSPAWTSRIAGFRARPAPAGAGASARFEPFLGAEARADDRAAAAVAALCSFVEASLAAHLATHPEDEPAFPPVDDAMIGRLFG